MIATLMIFMMFVSGRANTVMVRYSIKGCTMCEHYVDDWNRIAELYADHEYMDFKNVYCDVTPRDCEDIWQFPQIVIMSNYKAVPYRGQQQFEHLIKTIKTIPKPCVFPHDTEGCHDTVQKWIQHKSNKKDQVENIKKTLDADTLGFSKHLERVTKDFYDKQLIAEQKLMYINSL